MTLDQCKQIALGIEENVSIDFHNWSDRAAKFIFDNQPPEPPYQCYWQRRALAAEAELAETKRNLQSEKQL